MRLQVLSGRVVLPQGVEDASITIEDGVITDISSSAPAGAAHYRAPFLIAPAIIDIHGDAFERQVAPRPGVSFPLDVALLDTDRQLAAAGIATAYHALTLSWEPGLRSVEQGRAFLAGLEANDARFGVDHRIQLRWETFALEAIPVIERALAAPKTPAVAFNDHTSMTMRAFDAPLTSRPFEHGPDFVEASIEDPRMRPRITKDAKRAGLEEDAYLEQMGAVWARRGEIPDAIRTVAEAGRAAGAPMLSHDDATEDARSFYRALGANIAEFPMSKAIARRARERGEAVVLGSPNVVRGGSHIGSLSAADMVEADLCDVLASDYSYPAMLAAAGRLHQERRAPLQAIWSRLSSGPARALRLADRGEIAVGKRADLVVLDWPEGQTPAVARTIVAGETVYAGPALARGETV